MTVRLFCSAAYHLGLSAKSMYSSLYGTCFSANVSRALWQNGPAAPTWSIQLGSIYLIQLYWARTIRLCCSNFILNSAFVCTDHETQVFLYCHSTLLVQNDEYAAAA